MTAIRGPKTLFHLTARLLRQHSSQLLELGPIPPDLILQSSILDSCSAEHLQRIETANNLSGSLDLLWKRHCLEARFLQKDAQRPKDGWRQHYMKEVRIRAEKKAMVAARLKDIHRSEAEAKQERSARFVRVKTARASHKITAQNQQRHSQTRRQQPPHDVQLLPAAPRRPGLPGGGASKMEALRKEQAVWRGSGIPGGQHSSRDLASPRRQSTVASPRKSTTTLVSQGGGGRAAPLDGSRKVSHDCIKSALSRPEKSLPAGASVQRTPKAPSLAVLPSAPDQDNVKRKQVGTMSPANKRPRVSNPARQSGQKAQDGVTLQRSESNGNVEWLSDADLFG